MEATDIMEHLWTHKDGVNKRGSTISVDCHAPWMLTKKKFKIIIDVIKDIKILSVMVHLFSTSF
jgi:hypothetical protein